MTTKDKPDCFGDIDRVFPMASDGLRHSPESCLGCGEKTQCLKTAVSTKNQVVLAEERLDRTYQSGKLSFLQRWSRKKALHNQRKPKGAQRLKVQSTL